MPTRLHPSLLTYLLLLPLSTALKPRSPVELWVGWPTTTVVRTATVTRTSDALYSGTAYFSSTLTSTVLTTTIYPTSSGRVTVYSTTTLYGEGGDGSGQPATYTRTSTSTSYSAQATSSPDTLPPTADDLEQDIPRFSTCNPGDEQYEVPGGEKLSLTQQQKTTLAAIAIMFVVILISWNLVLIRTAMFPLKMLCLLIHEGGHIIVGVACANKLLHLEPDPQIGGMCYWEDPDDFYPRAAIPAGYAFSVIVGCALILAGFDTLASKVASFFIGILLAVVAVFSMGSVVALVLTALWIGAIIGFWFLEHAYYLRFYVLFIGVASAWYLIWDFIDDWVFTKVNSCCLILHRNGLGGMQPFVWLWIWFGITAVVFASTIIVGVYVFRQSPHSMFCQSQEFLPT